MGEELHIVLQKLIAPSINEKIMQRPRLTQRVNESKANIVNIIAPAGFGKTVLLSQLAETFNQPTVWYQLDRYDNDPAVFWRYLITGFQKLHSAFGREALFFIKNNQAKKDWERTVLSMLINELNRYQQGMTLIFDDCHVISETDVKFFIEELLYCLPSKIKVIMAGRTDIFQLGRVLVKGKMLEYGIKDLYFTSEDIAGYYDRNGVKLTDTELETIVKKTEGWPLAVSMLFNSPCHEQAGITETNMNSLFNYMASEILEGEEESIRRFLTAISVLEEITPKYCDLLLGRKDSRRILASLHKKYFFLCYSVGKNETYRYHQLFRDFLLSQIGNGRFELLEKAGTVAYQIGEVERAVEYFIAAGNMKKAGKTIVKAGRKIVGRGNWHTVERWLNGFSEEAIASNPWLALYKAQIDVNRGRTYSGENRVNHALSAFYNKAERVGLAESRLLKAKILRSQGRYRESLDLIELAIADLQGEEAEERFDICIEKSYVLMFCGRFAEAEEILIHALQLAEHRGDTVLMTYFYEGLGTVNFAWGYYDRALHYCRRGIAISPEKSLHNHIFQDSVGPIYQDWGELDYAYEYLLQSVTAKENFGPAESLPSTYCQFGNVLLDRGELQRAEKYFRKALSIMENCGGDHFVRVLSKLLLSICIGAQGRLVEAQELMYKARSEAGDQSQYINGIFDVIECLFALQNGNTEAAYLRLHKILPIIEEIGARKLLCISYSILALIGVLQKDGKDITEFTGKAFKLAAEMNFVHDFLLCFEIFQPLLYTGLERGIEVVFIQKIIAGLGEKAIPLLHRLAEHSDAIVRMATINPLSQIGGTKSAQILNKLCKDEEMQVSEQARRLLQNSGMFSIIAEESSPMVKQSIRIVLLGRSRIFYENKEITHINWIRGKSRDLLVYLAHIGSPVAKEKIIDALWPEIPHRQANAHFHINLHNLRRVLEEETGRRDLIVYRGGRYCLPIESIVVDKQRFLELLVATRHQDELSEQSAQLLEEAAALYQGDYLEEMDYTWVIPEQEYLKRMHNKAVDCLSKYYLNKKDYYQAIIHLERLVRDNPLTEEYYCRLLTAYAGIGDLKSISSHYHKLNTILKEELGLSPSIAIQNLYFNLIAIH